MEPSDTAKDAKSEIIDKLKNSNNVLVTVSKNPSVDQLAALLGLTLLLNKQGKHAAAVFSGEVPSTIEFLQPAETIEKNTDSLRDFIIALDKSKADKLRYKVEDNVVRIFITPYKTSITQEDLEFSQGDFNVDIVVAIGVREQGDLDEAITAHGRILHDATITSVTTTSDGELGSINWHDTGASSLSEMVTELAEGLDGSLIDNQIATALLTGIVAETKRFSNEKTTSQTMSISAVLMSAGANQQLVASKLSEEPHENVPLAEAPTTPEAPHGDGTIEINHDQSEGEDGPGEDEQPPAGPPPAPEPPTPPSDGGAAPVVPSAQISDVKATDSSGDESIEPQSEPADPSDIPAGNTKVIMTDPPELGGMLTANTQGEDEDSATDILGLPTSGAPTMLLDHNSGPATPSSDSATVPAVATSTTPAPEPVSQTEASQPPAWVPPAVPAVALPTNSSVATPLAPPASDTLTQIEASVDSPHLETPPELSSARDQVNQAMAATDVTPTGAVPPAVALNSQPFGGDLHPAEPTSPAQPAPATPAAEGDAPEPSFNDLFSSEPTAPSGPPAAPSAPLGSQAVPTAAPQVTDPTAPPPVPPPIPFQFGGPEGPTE